MPQSRNHMGVFVRRTLVVVATVVGAAILVYFLATLIQTLLVLFSGVLLAVLLNGLATLLHNRTPVSYGISVAVVTVALILAVVGLFYFAGPRIGDQIERLTVRLPQVVAQLKGSLNDYRWGRMLLNNMPEVREVLPFGSRQLISAPAAFGTLFGVIVNFIIILFVGLYLAASPQTYIGSALSLAPKERRPRLREVLDSVTVVLRRFFVGRFVSMAIVGVLTALGYWIAGIPLAFVLGLIAGILEFVPFIGPVLALIPALLLALAQGPVSALYVLIVYSVIQTSESYLITPLVERYAVSIPPGALITIQIVMGAVFGVVGIFLATPLAVIVIVAVQMLYIQDVLGDDVRVLGH